ncbi:MAG: SUMF1/EgtB/PvdO family nonheme iron enzyme [Bacteroidia bacterium]
MRVLLLLLPLFVLSAYKSPKELKPLYKHYLFVPHGEVHLQIQTDEGWKWHKDTVSSCLISITEVSNLDYREFVYWLKTNNDPRLQKMIPDSTVWAKGPLKFGQPFVDHYYSHPAYNDYPVVGVSVEQATAYCNWLTAQLAKTYPNIHVKARLPRKNEWIRAARGDSRMSYANGALLKNEEGLPMYNYKQIGDEYVSQSEEGEYIVIDSLGFDSDSYITTQIPSYYPNEFGLYNMCGNVAELVEEGVAMGGSWNSTGYDIRVDSEMPASKSCEIGFRVLLEIH